MTTNYLKKMRDKKTKMPDEKDLMDNKVESDTKCKKVESDTKYKKVEVDTQDKQVEDSIQDCTSAGDEAYSL